jgi:hypothetical protein
MPVLLRLISAINFSITSLIEADAMIRVAVVRGRRPCSGIIADPTAPVGKKTLVQTWICRPIIIKTPGNIFFSS